VLVLGELSRASGLGEGARLMVKALASLGAPTWSGESGARLHIPDLPSAAALLLHVNAPQLPAALLRAGRKLCRNRMIIGHWAWELPVVPSSWRAGARCVHEIWAPSRFTAEALQTLAQKDLPIRVVPYPVAVVPPTPSALSRVDFGWPDSAVVVLVCFNLASSFERKNPLAAIKAFCSAFGNRADRLLVLKLSHVAHYPADLARLRQAIGGTTNIRIDTTVMSRADSYALMAAADIVLSLHRSEGFGLVPAEAMLLGRPVVATNWSGNTDFMTGESAALVGFRLIPARDPRGVFEAPGAVWAEPDQDEAVAQLRLLADDAGLRRDLGARGRSMATERLGTAKLAVALEAIGMAARMTA
jgi:glycosyltransferase involved in cell wall biosynthesis